MQARALNPSARDFASPLAKEMSAMANRQRFDELARAAATESLGALVRMSFALALLFPLVTLTRLARQSDRLVTVTNEDLCYAAGGYLVEVQARPVQDWCCVCQDANGAICTKAAPKAVFSATDRVGRLGAQAVTCLLAGDKPAAGCTATCVSIPVRKSFTGFGG